DDVWLPRKLEVQLERTERAGAEWSYTRYEHMDAEGRPLPWRSGAWRELSGRIALPLISMEMAVCICTVMVERRLFETVGGFDESPGLREDLDLMLRLAVAADAVAVPEMLVQIREHEGRSTRAFADPFERTLAAYDRAARRVRDRELRPVLRRQRARLCVEAAAHRLKGRRFFRGLHLLTRAALLRARPREIAWALFRGDRPA
ncbi:MAG TPA: hypothetical protein VFI96_08380, partial [Longimicrobiaceae bacterium]|nr:hypothetical protein [Longimicrobiaceae bacterium]